MTAGDLAVTLGRRAVHDRLRRAVVVLVRVLDSLEPLRNEVDSLRQRDPPAARRAARQHRSRLARRWTSARTDLERFDRVLGSAEAISDAVDGVGPGRPHCVLGSR